MEGTPVETKKFCWHAAGGRGAAEPAVYVLNGKRVLRVRRDSYEEVANGTDGVLFVPDPHFIPFDLEKGSRELAAREEGLDPLFYELITGKINYAETSDSGVGREDLRMAFQSWFYGLFFGSIIPKRPVLLFCGEKGSGKSSAFTKSMIMLFGHDRNLITEIKDIRDFDTMLLNCSPIVVFDNVDGRQESWFPNRLATAATGGTINMRQLYTTSGLFQEKPDVWVGVTSRDAKALRRDDVSDRLIIMPVDRYDDFENYDKMIAEIMSNRDALWAETVGMIQHCLRSLYDEDGARLELPEDVRPNFRMGTFADFAQLINHEDDIDFVRDAFNRLAGAQREFAMEADIVYEMLAEWVEAPDSTIGASLRNGAAWRPAQDIALGINDRAKAAGIRLYTTMTGARFSAWARQKRSTLERELGMKRRKLGGRLAYMFEGKG